MRKEWFRTALIAVTVLLVLTACTQTTNKAGNESPSVDDSQEGRGSQDDTVSENTTDDVVDDLNFSDVDEVEQDLEDFNW